MLSKIGRFNITMKARYIKIVNSPENSFNIARYRAKHFVVPWHFHPELELNYIIDSSGARFVGDNIDRFSPGELTLVGSGLPHLWKNDADYYFPESEKKVDAIVIRFSPADIGVERREMPEMANVLKLFQTAKRGMLIVGPIKDMVTDIMKKMLDESGLQRYISLLMILNLLSRATDFMLLSSEGFLPTVRIEDTQRLNAVYDFILRNFRDDISLDKVAGIAFMNPASFSRYFRQHTGKPFIGFITEIRIGHACKMLIETDLSVTTIFYECGFRNQSNFNNFFRKKTAMTPLNYRKRHRENPEIPLGR